MSRLVVIPSEIEDDIRWKARQGVYKQVFAAVGDLLTPEEVAAHDEIEGLIRHAVQVAREGVGEQAKQVRQGDIDAALVHVQQVMVNWGERPITPAEVARLIGEYRVTCRTGKPPWEGTPVAASSPAVVPDDDAGAVHRG